MFRAIFLPEFKLQLPEAKFGAFVENNRNNSARRRGDANIFSFPPPRAASLFGVSIIT